MSLRALCLSAFSALLLLAGEGNAALTAALAPAVQNAARGTTVVFSGTLTNTSTTDKLFLNGLHATFTGSAVANVALQPNDYFANVPGILLPGETYAGPIFRLALAAAAPANDYAGTIVLTGGANIFATTDLASAAWTILSPAVSITASDPSAGEFGPDPGVFNITRTGGTGIALSAPFALSGSAGNGTAYQLLTPAVTIPAGAAAATVTITPIADHLVQGDRTATLTLSPSLFGNLGANTSATVTIHDTPADAWRLAHFGANASAPAAADTADWDGDGLRNLVEYALDLAPQTPDRAAFPVPFMAGGYLTLSYVPNPAALDVLYVVEAATDLTAWSTADVETVIAQNPVPPNRVTVRYRHPVSLTDHAYLRLTIQRP